MVKRLLWVIFLLILVFGIIFGIRGYQIYGKYKHFKNMPEPAMTISTVTATKQNWKSSLNSVGTLQSVNGVNVASQVAGQVIDIDFHSGQIVKKGQLLVRLDDSTDLQELKSLQATLKNAMMDYERIRQLYVKFSDHGGMSKSDLDTKKAAYENAKAMVAKQKMLINYKQIRAPFTGKVGMRNVNLGEFINPGTGFVYLQQITPLLLRFNLPERDLSLVKVGLSVIINVDTYTNQSFPGIVDAVSGRVDPDTHMVSVQATVPNATYKLYPGMFARVSLQLPEEKPVIVLPQTAVTYTSYGDTVYIVKSDGKDKTGKPVLRAYARFVDTGDKRGNQVVVLKGINEGDQVINSGQSKLSDKSRVAINNTVKLD